MLRITGDGIPGGEEDDLRSGRVGTFTGRRLKRALFVSGICLFSSMSVYALAPRESGPTETVPNLISNAGDTEDGRGLCVLYLERELWESFGTGVPDDAAMSSELDLCKDVVSEERFFQSETASELESEITGLVKGYPIETMVPTIAKYDREIAGLIVGIAKKESDWGKHAPSDGAGDCFNYWGYKGASARGTAMGYACFGSPVEAAQIVGDRIAELVAKRQASSPEKLIVWKCGNTCAGHSPESVRSWISGVRVYYDRIAKL
jgi:hypothetical protein